MVSARTVSPQKLTRDAVSVGSSDQDVPPEQDRLCIILVPKHVAHALDARDVLVRSAFASLLDTHCHVTLSEPGGCSSCGFASVRGQPCDIQRCVAKLICAFHELGQPQGAAVASATIVVPEAHVWRVTGRKGHLQQKLAKSTRCLVSIGEPVDGVSERLVSVMGKLPDVAKAARVICRRILTQNPAEANNDQCLMPRDEMKAADRKLSVTISSLALEPGTPSHTPSTAASPQIPFFGLSPDGNSPRKLFSSKLSPGGSFPTTPGSATISSLALEPGTPSHTPSTAASAHVPFFGLSPNGISPRKLFSSKLSPDGSFPTTPSIPEVAPYAKPEQQALDHGAAPFASLM